MKNRYIFSTLVMLLILIVLASNSSNVFANDGEKCSAEIEGLKLCTTKSNYLIESGEPVRIKLFWVNSKDVDRHFVRYLYDISVTDEKGEKITSVLDKKIKNGLVTEEDWKKFMRGGSDRGISIDANKTESTELQLTENYNYDFTTKGKYYVKISKTVPSLEGEKTIEYTVEGIGIEIK